MRGRLIIAVWKRTLNTTSTRWKDKWAYIDKVAILSIIEKDKGMFKTISLKKGLGTFIISRDELAFIKLIYACYGAADYSIRFWGKGKNRGIRNFWDGLITEDKKFLRRRGLNIMKTVHLFNPSSSQKLGESENPESQIGRYFRTKRPGKWYHF